MGSAVPPLHAPLRSRPPLRLGGAGAGKSVGVSANGAKAPSVAVVIPAYRVAGQIAEVIARVPSGVAHIVVVDDASPDDLRVVLERIDDCRLVVLHHATNLGVGAAMKTGFAHALQLGADIVVKVDGDGQMDPALIPRFVDALANGEADFCKGNRFDDAALIRQIPMVRRVGNLALSFLVKAASGYWRSFDPVNGFLAVRAEVLRAIRPERLANRYFFEISLLCEAYAARAVLRDVPMAPVYRGEPSSLSPLRSAITFGPRLIGRIFARLWSSYFIRDFNVVSILLVCGAPLLSFGTAWSAYHWMQSTLHGVPATAGTVMVGTLPIVLGFQLMLQALVLDVANEPARSR